MNWPWISVSVVVALAGCRFHFDEIAADPSGDAISGEWSSPQPVDGAHLLGQEEEDPALASDASELYFVKSPIVAKDIFVMTRLGSTWSVPAVVSINATNRIDSSPRLADDDLTMYFSSDRGGGPGGEDLFRTTRSTVGGAWTAPQLVGAVNSPGADLYLTVCASNAYVVVIDFDLYEGQLGTPAPTLIQELQSPGYDSGASLSADCLTLYFASDRAGGQRDLFVTQRAAVGQPWGIPRPLPGVNDPSADDEDPTLSRDGRTMVFSSNRAGSLDLYLSTR